MNELLLVLVWIFLGLILLYFIAYFVLSRFFIPYLGFRKSKLPDKIPVSMRRTILELRKRSRNKQDFLEKSFNFIITKYTGARRKTLTRFERMFWSLERVWKHSGFIQCTQQNNVLRIFLVKSGFFKDSDIKLNHFFYEFSIHQYLVVNVDGKKIILDPWGYFLGVRPGSHVVSWKSY